MFRRQQPAQGGVAVSGGASGAATGRADAFGRVEDLLRPAEWAQLPEAQRAALRGAHPTLDAPAGGMAASSLEPAVEPALQDWVAGIVAPRFQREAVAGVRAWLEGAPADAHLFVGGRQSLGRTSLVASLARAAMAQRPAPPDYVYVPDPDDLERALLLAVPRGTGAKLGESLGGALADLSKAWEGASAGHLVAQHLGPVEAAAPEAARAYLARLRARLAGMTGRQESPLGDDVPMAHVTPSPDAAPGAPVVLLGMQPVESNDALLRANGGVLIAPAGTIDVGALAAALRARALYLKSGWPPIPLTVRVILVGGDDAYGAYWSSSDDVPRAFRYEVWLNDYTDWTREAEATYAALADGVARRYALPRFDPTGVGRLVQEGARRTGGLSRYRLSTDLLLLHDLAFEAGQIARARGATATTGAEVEAALFGRRALQGATARAVRDGILSGETMTPTAGAFVGQINGLGIFEWHPYEGTFAVPMRISATASPGREEQIVDIEREAAQTDADHVRGTMTMEGYLASRYGQNRPLSLLARVRFEQEHGATGGDSASGAELFALLSSLAQIPIRASIAVTGAVGQYGEIQPIGGVNWKVEGFYDLCRIRRERGEQPQGDCGVLIPAVNARDLMLRPDVAAAIANEGWFRIYLMNTVDEAIPVLMGVPAETLHQRVEQRLARFHELAARTRG